MASSFFGLSFDGFIFVVALGANFLSSSYLSTFSVLGFINTLDQRWVMIFSGLTFPILLLGLAADLLKKTTLRWTALFLAIILLVIAPTITSMYLRLSTKPYLFVHDNPIQIEESIKFLLAGKNPYSEDFSKTPMKDWQYGPPVYSFKPVRPPESYFQNPALYHNVSLPFGLLAPVPFFLVFQSLFNFFDVRIFYLFVFVLLLVCAGSLIPKASRFSFLALFALNPYFVTSTLEGRNDVLTILLIVFGLMLAYKKKFLYSAIPIGLAVATKQSAWVFLLVYLVYLFYKLRPLVVRKFFLIVLLTGGSLVIPFLLWDSQSFINDTILYVSGGMVTSYPIVGAGFSSLLFAAGVLRNSLVYYPAIIFELLFGLPTLALCVFLIRKRTTIRMLVLSYSLLLLVILFFSRFFLTSYFGVVLQFLILGYFLPEEDESR